MDDDDDFPGEWGTGNDNSGSGSGDDNNNDGDDEPPDAALTFQDGTTANFKTDRDLFGGVPGDANGPFTTLTLDVAQSTGTLGQNESPGNDSAESDRKDKELPDSDDAVGNRGDWIPLAGDDTGQGPGIGVPLPTVFLAPPQPVQDSFPLWAPGYGGVDQMRCWMSPQDGVRCQNPLLNPGGGADGAFDLRGYLADKASDFVSDAILDCLVPNRLDNIGRETAVGLGREAGVALGEVLDPAGGGAILGPVGGYVGGSMYDSLVDGTASKLAPPELDNRPQYFNDARVR